MEQLKHIQKVADDIRTITIQGATNIAKQGMIIMRDEIAAQKFSSIQEFEQFLLQAAHMLKTARATEPMLFNGLNVCLAAYNKHKDTNNLEQLQAKVSEACAQYVDEIEKENKVRPWVWAELIKDGYNIATHCHSWTVVKVITKAWEQGKKIHVYNSETRPLYQGRKTSLALLEAGVPDTMIPDSAAPFFVDNKYESRIPIDIVLLGSDAIKRDGSVYNKVGSFSIALSAWNSNIPVYIVGSVMKIDLAWDVVIEERDWKELWEDAPEWLEILNYAFDMVPAEFITGIITEHGIIKPSEIEGWAKKLEKGEY